MSRHDQVHIQFGCQAADLHYRFPVSRMAVSAMPVFAQKSYPAIAGILVLKFLFLLLRMFGLS
jgi:hypothetical protein